MTARATEAGQLIQKLKTEITAQNASHLLRDDYQMPDIAAAKLRQKSQEERMAKYEQIDTRLLSVNGQLNATRPPPPPEHELWGERTTLENQQNALKFEGRSKEIQILNNLEKTVKDRLAELQQDQAKAAKIITLLEKVGVAKDIRDRIGQNMDQHAENPGNQMKMILKTIVDNSVGDQETVRRNAVEKVRKIPVAKDVKTIDSSVLVIREQIITFNRSKRLSEDNGTFPEEVALEALERICLDNTIASATIRDCKKEPTTYNTFDKMERKVKNELERIANMTGGLDSTAKSTDPISELSFEMSSSVVAMGAIAGSSICISFNNTGRCSRGDSCRFDHRRTGFQLTFPQAPASRDRERSRERDRESSQVAPYRNKVSGGDNRGGGGGNWDRSGGGSGSGITGGGGYYRRDGDSRGGSDGSNPRGGRYSSPNRTTDDRGRRDQRGAASPVRRTSSFGSSSSQGSGGSGGGKATPSPTKKPWKPFKPDTPRREH
jgi:hypothetical protein